MSLQLNHSFASPLRRKNGEKLHTIDHFPEESFLSGFLFRIYGLPDPEAYSGGALRIGCGELTEHVVWRNVPVVRRPNVQAGKPVHGNLPLARNLSLRSAERVFSLVL